MKKLIITVAIVCTAAILQAASVGWSNANLATYNNDKYLMFVIGQNGATDVATITALLDAGTAVDSYAIGGGTVTSGSATKPVGASSPTIADQGTYTAFMVLFDAATPTAGSTKYIVLQGGNGGTGYTQTIGPSTASITFVGGNAATMVAASEWKTYGAPEPTSGVLLLLGMAGLALKRRRA